MFNSKGALLSVLATAAIFSGKADANNIGIAFSGGGFKSVADQTAVTAGLLAELMKRDPKALRKDSISSPLAASGLYENVKSISTISGGSWFTSYLVYSMKYRAMVEEMARKAAYGVGGKKVSEIFFEKYGQRFDDLRASNDSTNDAQALFVLLDGLVSGLPVDEKGYVHQISNGLRTALMFSQTGSDGGPQSSWYSVTKDILGDDINQKTLGSEVQEWSKGKSWNIVTSVTVPSGLIQSNIWVDQFNLSKVGYCTKGEDFNVLFVPVLFSVVLGNDGSPAAPLPSSVYSVTEKLTLTYTGKKLSQLFGQSLKPKIIETGIQPQMDANKSFADMPILGPVAASSAAIGLMSILPDTVTAGLTSLVKLNPQVGFACKEKDPSASFSTGQGLIDNLWNKGQLTNEDFEDITQKGVCNFLDGGATDPFAIGTALASGADEIFCVNAIPDLLTVQKTHFDPPLLGQKTLGLFQECKSNVDIGEPNFESNNSVENMTFQTIKVKTVENVYFGIEKDREVTLHIFSVQSKKIRSADMVGGSVDTFKDIGEYIEDIMETFADAKNKDGVDKMLNALGALKN